MPMQITQYGTAVNQCFYIFGIELNRFVVAPQSVIDLVQLFMGCRTDQPKRRKTGVGLRTRHGKLNRLVIPLAVEQKERQRIKSNIVVRCHRQNALEQRLRLEQFPLLIQVHGRRQGIHRGGFCRNFAFASHVRVT